MKIEQRPLAKILPYPGNARKISTKAVAKVAESIKTFGWRQPIVVDKKGVVVVGHARLLAAKELKLKTAPVHVAAELTPQQIRLYRLADNRSHDEAKWDDALLGMELGDLMALGANLELSAFDPSELDRLLSPNEADAARADREVTVPELPSSKRGDLWLLGAHRLLCGDSTDAETVSAVLKKSSPKLMVTDPPYGVEYDPKWREQFDGFERHATGLVKNDDRVDWTKVYKSFPGDVVYLWHAGVYAADVALHAAAAGFKIRSQIIWRKQHFVFSRGAYHWQHEPCWYAVREGANASWLGGRKQTTVWDVANLNPMGGNTKEAPTGHGTQKPIELMRRAIVNHIKRGGEVFDPFLGSGTTMLAAEVTERVCFGIEIDPRYVDAAVKRWQDYTGKVATLEATGQTFAEVVAARAVKKPAVKKSPAVKKFPAVKKSAGVKKSTVKSAAHGNARKKA